MIIRSLNGDDEINGALTKAMIATIERLRVDEVLSLSQAMKFIDEHVCILIDKDGPFTHWIKKHFGKDQKGTIIVAKIP